MADDQLDIPDFLRPANRVPLTREQQQRLVKVQEAALATARPGRLSEDEVLAFKAQAEAERKARSYARLERMRQKNAARTVDYSKVRWCPRRNAFVPK